MAVCFQVLERCAASLPLQVVACRNRDAPLLDLGPHHHQLVGIGIWHGLKQRGIDHTEDGRGRANAEGQRQYRDKCEARLFEQYARAVAQVLPQCVHHTPSHFRLAISDCRLKECCHLFGNRKSPIGNQLFVSQRHHRIDLRRAARWHETSSQGHSCQHQRDGDEDSRIGCADPEQQRGQQARQGK